MERDLARWGKMHCEAFPAIDVLAALRAQRSGGDRCEWRDERGNLIGNGQVVSLDAHSMTFRYAFGRSRIGEVADGQLTLRLAGSQRNPQHIRYSMCCPNCGNAKQILFFVVGSWSCRNCHKLIYRKQRLSAIGKKVVYHDEVCEQLLLISGSSPITRNYHNLKRHAERIERELVEGGVTELPEEISIGCHTRWLSPGEELIAHAGELAEYSLDRKAFEQVKHSRTPQRRAKRRPCEAIGMLILNRPLSVFLEQHVEAQLRCFLAECKASQVEPGRVPRKDVVADLARSLVLRPLALVGDWSEVEHSYSSDERAESSIRCRYNGDPTLWRIGADDGMAQVPLQAILDDTHVTLKVRLPSRGRSNADAELEAAVEDLQACLLAAAERITAFNMQALQIAQQILSRGAKASEAITRTQGSM